MVVTLQDKTPKKNIQKTYPVCFWCKRKMDIRITRGVIVKSFFFWLPLRRYKCSGCGRKRYILAGN